MASRAKAVKREFPETDAAFGRVRQAMIERLVTSPVTAAEEREKLFLSVQVLDAVRKSLVDAIGLGSEAIEHYLRDIRTQTSDEAKNGRE